MWPRVIRMVERGIYPVHKVISAQIRAEEVVEKGFQPLLDPAGEQMKFSSRWRDELIGRSRT